MLNGISTHAPSDGADREVTKARQEKNGLARSIVYTSRATFWERVPFSPVLGLPFRKGRARSGEILVRQG